MMHTTTFNPAKLDAVKTIVTHEGCPDGTASAILLKDAFQGREVNFKFLQYGTEAFAKLEPEPGMLFCDFSPPADRARDFIDAGALILDHHWTAKGTVEAFGANGVFGDEKSEPGVCGAVLAFRHVWVPLRGELAFQKMFAAEFSMLAGVRDTWQRHSPRWKDACVQGNVLNFIPVERWLSRGFEDISASWDREFKPIGEILWEKNETSTNKSIAAAHRFTSKKGTRVVAFDGLRASSDTAEKLGGDADLVVGFMVSAEDGVPKYIYSTRSHTTFNCASFAKAHGGGGHTKAAGFNVPINPESTLNPYAVLASLVDAFEATT